MSLLSDKDKALLLDTGLLKSYIERYFANCRTFMLKELTVFRFQQNDRKDDANSIKALAEAAYKDVSEWVAGNQEAHRQCLATAFDSNHFDRQRLYDALM